MKGGWLAWASLLAACGPGVAESNGEVSANQIERLSTPKTEERDPLASARLEPIAAEEAAREGLAGAGCAFTRDGRLLLAVVASDAIVRVEGEIRHLVHSGPVGPTGGFFEERQLSVSVGRADENGVGEDDAVDEGRGGPARITVTNRRTDARHELAGVWTCGG